eukprot:GEMP01011749.1.p1 GENE.GEMP01011749.1~~GEMP01011749.1.p1  ORF type:complete len:908 (+),score=297.54 GEMP01011749.1:32-2725(+)
MASDDPIGVGVVPMDGNSLPPFASEYNRQLDAEIKAQEAKIQVLAENIDDNATRIKIMTDHLTNVQQELVHTQQLVDAKKKEMDTEEHMTALANRQLGRINAEIRRLADVREEYKDRTNALQTQCFAGNERLDQFKLKMNWNQEELEQWALAARQKEEDELALEKYRRADELKIRDLTLETERTSLENIKKKRDLESEVTETQAQQITLEKVAEQFRALHEDRKKLIQQWEDAVNAMKARDAQLEGLGTDYAERQKRKMEKEGRMKEKKRCLTDAEQENSRVETDIGNQERQLGRIRQDHTSVREGLQEFKDSVDVLKNQVGAAATEESKERTSLANIKVAVEERTLKLSQLKTKLEKKKAALDDQRDNTMSSEEAAKMAEEKHKGHLDRLGELEKEHKGEKDELYKLSEELFRLRNTEASVLGEIAGAQSGITNLQFQIKKLDQERQRQQELLYSVDFQSQLMQRKVARASGERSLEERADLEKKIEGLNEQIDEQNSLNALLAQQNKRQGTDLKNAMKHYENVQKENVKLAAIMEEVELQNSIMVRTMSESTKEKEEALVHHEVMKLEVKRLRNAMNQKTDALCSLENRKQQLQISMEEREKEIEVHQEVLKGHCCVSQDDKHRVAIELSERKQKIHNLKNKYETVMKRTKHEDGEEHSQAYYVLKAAQQKEELQRMGDALDAEIHQAEREVRALENSLGHLLSRNQKYKEQFKKSDENTLIEIEERRMLEEQARAANEVLFKKRKQLGQMQKDREFDNERLQGLKKRGNTVEEEVRNFMDKKQQLDAELDDAENRIESVDVECAEKKERAGAAGIDVDGAIKYELELSALKNANLAFRRAVSSIMKEPPFVEEINPLFQSLVQERRLNWSEDFTSSAGQQSPPRGPASHGTPSP